MYILGISAFYHDSSICLLKNGEIIFACHEERFTRKKNESGFPTQSIIYLLKNFNIKLNDIDYIVFYEKPFIKFERLIERYVFNSPFGFKSFITSIPYWVREKIFQKRTIIKKLKEIEKNFIPKNKILFSNHHLSHAASSYYASPFSDALTVTIDGVGEWTTTEIFVCENEFINPVAHIKYPHSLGLLYSAFTQYLGFEVNEDEYKVMGLAPYGRPIYVDKILGNIIFLNDDVSFKLNLKYFKYETELRMIGDEFVNFFNNPIRKKNQELNQFHKDLACSLQEVLEEVVIKILRHFKKKYNKKYLCMAGGVALNCTMNGKILKEKLFDDIFIQPASGDAGTSLGAALIVWHQKLKNKKINNFDIMKNCYLGPSFSNDEIYTSLKKLKAKFITYSSEEAIIANTAELLSKDYTIGWFQNKAEFGPRALGSRSILADPRNANMKKILNKKIKFRESFRPFAPSILEEKAREWFDININSPYMTFVCNIKENYKLIDNENQNTITTQVPAVTHVDFSARIQTVNEKNNGMYYRLIKKFYEITGCPMIINTSFNINREPIVNTVEDAYRSFLISGLDVLVCGNFILFKKDQYELEKVIW
jgi:carbamoyltransferase